MRVLHIEAGAVVAHEINFSSAALRATNFNHCWLAATRILYRIGKQVDPDLFEQRGVTVAGRQA